MRISYDCLHNVFKFLDIPHLIVASQVNVEWYNLSMLRKFWRRQLFVQYPSFLEDKHLTEAEHADLNHCLNRRDRKTHTLWKIMEKRYNNDPRHLLLDRNNNNASVVLRWPVASWSVKMQANERLRSPFFYVGDAKFQILCYPCVRTDGGLKSQYIRPYTVRPV